MRAGILGGFVYWEGSYAGRVGTLRG